jgi:hypothetical protein
MMKRRIRYTKKTKKCIVYIVFFSLFGSTFPKGRMSLISGFVTHFWFSMNMGYVE